MQTDVEKIKERIGILDLIESYIKVEKAGKNFKARCPFHNEKTPSFFISPDRGTYYCFGCGAKGDIFSFVQQFEATDFPGALKILADRAGVQIQNISKEANSRTKRIKDILELAAKYFEKNLSDNAGAAEYLKSRGLTEKTIEEWRIGFASAGWQNLYDHLIGRNYSADEILQAGLIKKGERGRYYDTFRSRIMFPIFNSAGDVIAFTGRIFEEASNSKKSNDVEVAKYINSPETDLFKKSEILYGLNRAKSVIRKNDFSILVEGQMDTIMCHQIGYANAVASSGTAITEHQLEALNKLSSRIVIAFDSDSAGFKASEKAWKMALSMGMDVKIAPIRGEKDPADLIRDNPEKWRDTVRGAQHIIEVLIEKIQNAELNRRQVGQAVTLKVIPYLKMIGSKIDRDHFVKVVGSAFGIKEDAIYSDLHSSERQDSARAGNVPVNSAGRIAKNISGQRRGDEYAIEKRLLGIAEWQNGRAGSSINSEQIREEMRKIVGDDFTEIIRSISDSLDQIIFTLDESYEDEAIVLRDIEELMNNLKIKYLNRDRDRMLQALRVAENSADEKTANELLSQVDKVSKKIENLKNFTSASD